MFLIFKNIKIAMKLDFKEIVIFWYSIWEVCFSIVIMITAIFHIQHGTGRQL